MELNRFLKLRISNSTGTIVYNIDGSTAGLGISAGSLNLQEILCESGIEFGAYCANKLEVEVYGLTHDVTGMKILLYNQYGSQSATNLFTGYIESSTTDNKNGYRKIVAYDKMYSARDLNVASWWNTYWTNRTTSTLKALRESLCAQGGFELVARVLTNDNLAVPSPGSFTAITFSKLLKMICELQGCVPCVNRSGLLDFVTLDTSATSITTTYDQNDANFEDYTTATITGINVYSTSDDLTQTVGVAGNCYSIAGNIFLLAMTGAQVTTALTPILTLLSAVQYRPGEIPLITSDLTYLLGDKLSITIGSTTQYHYIFSQEFSGIQLVDQKISSSAQGEYFDEKVSAANNEIIDGLRYSSLKQDVQGIYADVYDAETGRTKLEITAEGLETEIEDVDGRVTTVTATVNGLTVTDSGGQTLINGSKVQTSNLYINRIWSYEGSINSYAEMEDAGMTFHLGVTGRIFLGYDSSLQDIRLPYMKLSVDDGSQNQDAGIIERLPTGVWIGDDELTIDETYHRPTGGTGLFIDMERNIVYKYIEGTAYELSDSTTVTATFG